MKMLIVGCSGAKPLAKRLARKLKVSYSDLKLEKFPNNEIKIRFLKSVKNKEVVLMQSFYGGVSEKTIEVLFAAHTAKELGAKKIILLAPYLAYLRQDKRFHPGEGVSAKIIAKLFKIFDKVYVVDPHLHRFKKFSDFFQNAKRITCVKQIADYIKKNVSNYVIVGPDKESFQWAERAARLLGKKALILHKKRITSERVQITKIHKNLKDKNLIIIDDIISTGGTMLEVIKNARKLKPKKIFCITVHGVFADDALKKLQKHAKVISSNTIPNKVAKIDVLPSLLEVFRK